MHLQPSGSPRQPPSTHRKALPRLFPGEPAARASFSPILNCQDRAFYFFTQLSTSEQTCFPGSSLLPLIILLPGYFVPHWYFALKVNMRQKQHSFNSRNDLNPQVDPSASEPFEPIPGHRHVGTLPNGTGQGLPKTVLISGGRMFREHHRQLVFCKPTFHP